MKKLFASLLVAALAIAMVGCGRTPPDKSPTPPEVKVGKEATFMGDLDSYEIMPSPDNPTYTFDMVGTGSGECYAEMPTLKAAEEWYSKSYKDEKDSRYLVALGKVTKTTNYYKSFGWYTVEEVKHLDERSFSLSEVELLEVFDQRIPDGGKPYVAGDKITTLKNYYPLAIGMMTAKEVISRTGEYPYPFPEGVNCLFIMRYSDEPKRFGNEHFGFEEVKNVWREGLFFFIDETTLQLTSQDKVKEFSKHNFIHHYHHLYPEVIEKYFSKKTEATQPSDLDQQVETLPPDQRESSVDGE